METRPTIYSRFKEQVTLQPDLPAVLEDGARVTFAQLDALADRILSKFHKKEPHMVGIVMHHGVLQIAAMLAVLKSGAGYVPAEPGLPKNRIDYMMRQAGVELMIDDAFCCDLPDNVEAFPDRSKPSDIAYILFTSGTSGVPKGVVVENRSVVNYAEAFEVEMKVGPGDVMLQFSVCSFDIFVEEVFASLLNGVTLAIPSWNIHEGPMEGVMDFCRRHGVTILDGFPYMIADLNREPSLMPDTIRLIISGGDVIRGTYITNLKGKGVRIYNTYGPSETTVCATYFRIDNSEPLADGTFPVGTPVKGVKVRILSQGLEEVKDGETGEICILGEGVSRGYLGNPPEQANFITLPNGERMYRSGDMGYRLPDGNIAFLHRLDDQVMILGRRVEPEEVENVLNGCKEIERGIVRAFKDDRGLHFLVAYFVPGEGFSIRDLKDHLRSRLADFMIPEFFIALDRIPITHRGKVDVQALPKVMKEGKY